jgi:hypothetical protein
MVSKPTATRPSDTVEVTATNDNGSTTVTRTVTVRGSAPYRFPSPIYAEVGTKVTLQTALDFMILRDTSLAYRFAGDIPGITWTPINPQFDTISDGTMVSFIAPAKVGSYNVDLLWNDTGIPEVDRRDGFTVKTYKADAVNDTRTFDGITEANKPLKCPGKAPFSWYINNVLRYQTDSPYLPIDAQKEANAAINCVSTDPKTGRPMETRALVADGTKLTATATGKTIKLVISRPSSVMFTLSVSSSASTARAAAGKKGKTIAWFKVKVKKGRATVKLPKKALKKIGKRKFQIAVRVVGKKGKKSRALTLNGN